MSTKYERAICYSEGKDSVYTEGADCLSEAIDREMKFFFSQRHNNAGRQLISITVTVFHDNQKR
jgi:hypothetical protein